MNDSGEKPRFKSKNQRNKWGDEKKNFLPKEESDYEMNESVTDDENGEIFFFTEMEENEAKIYYEAELRSSLK